MVIYVRKIRNIMMQICYHKIWPHYLICGFDWTFGVKKGTNLLSIVVCALVSVESHIKKILKKKKYLIYVSGGP
jgi:hypothetical protein